MNSMLSRLGALSLAFGLAHGAALADATRLGADLTPTGAEKAGNADGTIPAWNGGLQGKSSDGRHLINPFSGDTEQFRIDASNVDQHASKLSAGQIAMIRRYPDSYFIPVYQTRRAFAHPDWLYKAIRDEAGAITVTDGGNGISGMRKSTVPFPIPDSGVEALWNHLTRYRPTWVRNYVQAPVQSNGSYTLQKLRDTVLFRSTFADDPENDNTLFKFMQEILAPARLEGNVLLVHEFINQVKEPRAAWIYNAGQRRVRRAPNIAYDGPGTAAEGTRTTDDFDIFNGSPDKYEWKIVGKREMYVPANSYSLADRGLSYADALGEKHLNQTHTRYELRRVWVVDGTLRSGERHIYGRRTLYLDEDSWYAVLADVYDGRGELWRVREGHSALESTSKSLVTTGEPVYDLQAGRYLGLSLISEESPQFDYSVKLRDGDFSPAALRRRGRK